MSKIKTDCLHIFAERRELLGLVEERLGYWEDPEREREESELSLAERGRVHDEATRLFKVRVAHALLDHTDLLPFDRAREIGDPNSTMTNVDLWAARADVAAGDVIRLANQWSEGEL